MKPQTLSRIIFYLALCLTCYSALAQQQTELDSLLKKIRTLPADTSKVRVYGRISVLYAKSHKQNDEAMKYADSTRLLSEALHFDAGIASSHFYYGNIYAFESKYDLALDHFFKNLRFYEQQADSFRMINALFAIGKVYKGRSDLEKAIDTYYRLVEICERTNDVHGLALARNSMGGIFRQMNNYKEAISYYKQANATFSALNMTKDYGMGLQNIGNVYNTMKKYDSAIFFDKQALEIVHGLNADYEEAMVLGNIGEVYQQLNQYEKALPYQVRSLSLKRNLPNRRSLTFGLHDIGLTYLKLKRYPEAEAHLKEGLALARDIKSKDLLQELYERLADLSVARNDFREAYRLNQISQQWKDSILNENSFRQINELQTKYEAEKKDKQIILLAKEKEIQAKEVQRQTTLKQALVGGLTLVALLSGLIVYATLLKLKNQNHITEKDNELREARFKHEMATLEMKALRAQINPHFLFNCINSINLLIVNGENENASLYLTKFSKLIRLILENTEKSTVSLQSEMLLLESYIQLEELRFKQKINYEISIDTKIVQEDTYLPSMVLQPFIENAIWHGLMHKGKDEKGMIRIQVKEKEETLMCTIEDNGVGRETARELNAKSLLKSKSMGIKITEERLRLLSKERLKELVHITDLKDALDKALGTRVEISIPIS
jgi:tetratricopeptide (TPR) repeat protein